MCVLLNVLNVRCLFLGAAQRNVSEDMFYLCFVISIERYANWCAIGRNRGGSQGFLISRVLGLRYRALGNHVAVLVAIWMELLWFDSPRYIWLRAGRISSEFA